MNEIIQITQLPEIVEKLDLVSEQVKKEVENALSLICNEDTVKEIKKTRAELTKEFNELESQRKIVKNAIMDKYNQFENIYKEKVGNLYKNADNELKNKIDQVEYEMKKEKETELREFANEYFKSYNLCIDFEKIGLNITLSASMKSLKEQIIAFCEKVSKEIELINTEEYKEEILFEYQKTLDYTSSKLEVINRHKKIEEIKRNNDDYNALTELENKNEEINNKIIEEVVTPKEIIEDDEIITVSFKVTGSKSKIIELKNKILELELKYE